VKKPANLVLIGLIIYAIAIIYFFVVYGPVYAGYLIVFLIILNTCLYLSTMRKKQELGMTNVHK